MTTLDKLNEALDKLNDVKDTYSFCEISDENENNTLEHLVKKEKWKYENSIIYKN